MILKFSKMHGLGNDFVVLDAVTNLVKLPPSKVRKLCDRHFGIGCDQLLLVEPPTRVDDDFFYRIYNSDGSEAGHCGNGARCVAHYVYHTGLTTKRTLRMSTNTTRFTATLSGKHNVTVNMGEPNFSPSSLPFTGTVDGILAQVGDQQLPIVSVGNPHVIVDVKGLDTLDIEPIASAIQANPLFAEGVNVGFREIVSRDHIKLRVYERGAGETLACGTGACAAAITGIAQNILNFSVKVSLKGGDLKIDWRGRGHHVMMSGPATKVFHGQIKI